MTPSSEFQLYLSKTNSWPQSSVLNEVISWDRAHFPTPWTEVQWFELGDERDYLLIVGETEFALFKLSPLEELAHLLKIVVLPKNRKQKRGASLLAFSLKECRHLGFHRFYLEVEENNLSAIKLYQSLGFNFLNKISHFYGTNSHAWAMGMES